ncbi:MAG: signal peptidase II [Bacillota bacterium]|nr:signal peptidase II [Bacillota bacterium]
MSLILITAVIIALDQLSKYMIASSMELGQTITIIDKFFYITYVRNPGAAFGMFPYQTVFFVVITVIVVLVIIYYYRLLAKRHRWLRVGLALQLGGALGNLIDRVRGTYVIDFLDFSIWPPVFNLADSAIVIGIAFLLIAFWRDSNLIKEFEGS